MGNWVSRPGTEGGWETVWDASAPDAPTMTDENGDILTQQGVTDAEGNIGYQWVRSAAAPKTWQDIALDNWQEARDSNGNSLVSQLSQIRPGYDWTNELQQTIANHRAVFGSGWTQWSSIPAIVNEIAQRAGMQNPYSQEQIQQAHDSLVSAHAAANQEDDGFLGLGDLGTLLAIGGGIYGLGSLAGVFGGVGSAGAAGAGLLDTVLPAELFAGGAAASGGAGALGLDAITAADMAAGDAMLGGMGQDYGSFLNSLGGGTSVASTSMPLNDPFNAGNPGLLESTSAQNPVNSGLLDTATSQNLTGVSTPTTGGTTTMPLNDPWGSGTSQWWENLNIPDYQSNLIDSALGPVTPANTGNAQWDAILNERSIYDKALYDGPSGGGGGSFVKELMSKFPSMFTGQGGGSGGVGGSTIGGVIGALTGLLGGSKQTGTQTSIQDIPEWQKPFVLQAMQGAKTAYENSTPSPLLIPAEQQMLDTIQGKYLDPNSNPYLRDTFDQASKAVTDSYLSTTQPRTDALFGRSGQAFGGNSGFQETVARNQFGLGQNLKNLATDIYGGNYTRERQNQVNTTQNTPGFVTGQVGARFAPVNNYATISGQRTGSQTSTPLYENKAGQALYGGLLGSQIFRP